MAEVRFPDFPYRKTGLFCDSMYCESYRRVDGIAWAVKQALWLTQWNYNTAIAIDALVIVIGRLTPMSWAICQNKNFRGPGILGHELVPGPL